METTGYTYKYLSASMCIYIYLPTYMQTNDVHGHSRMALYT